MNQTSVAKLTLEHQPGQTLQREFYTDPDIYQVELEKIFFRSWLYVGHVSEIPDRGDYFLFQIDRESVIITNEGDDRIRGLVNVCRHRGARICSASKGSQKLLVCPYHGWTYELSGALRGAGYLPADFDRKKFGLKQVQVRVFHGMIFINFSADPVPFEDIERELEEPLRPYGLARAKVALRRNYPIAANWKLAVENYCECYHCKPAHPEYALAHGRAIPHAEMLPALKPVMDRAQSCGLTTHSITNEWITAGPVGADRAFDRYPLYEGHVTGSRDGKPVAPLLGDIRAYDGGCTDMHIGPMTFYLAYCDHVVVYRFTPRSLDTSDCEISWLVRGDAVEGRDYKLDDLIWLWDVTTIADKRIIEANAAGVGSRYYEPGPYMPMEDFARRFIHWYLHAMRQ
jgi:Rieske 2Fe-2S family protein